MSRRTEPRTHPEALSPPVPGPSSMTPRQVALGELLAALLVADYRANPPATVESPSGSVRRREAVKNREIER